MNASNHTIDFDLSIDHLNKLTVLVKNIGPSTDENLREKSFECDCFGQTECHHHNDHSHKLNEETSFESCLANKCSYCAFFDCLNSPTNSHLKLNDKHKLFINYAKKIQNLDWCEFQPRRRPFGLIAYATCHSKSDLLAALKKYEASKIEFKNRSFNFKLFINFTEVENKPWISELNLISKLNLSEADLKRLAYRRNVSNYSLPVYLPSNRTSTLDLDHLNEEKEEEEKNGDPLDSSNYENNDLIPASEEASIQKYNDNSSQSETVQTNPTIDTEFDTNDEIELNEKLRSLDNHIVFMHSNKSNKVEPSIQEFLAAIFKQLLALAKSINPNEDGQLSLYSDVLKLPYEKADSNERANLTMKMVNKKKTSIRMNKYKADLMMCLNLIDSAVFHYSQAYNMSRREMNADPMWSHCSLEGLCVASYFYSLEKPGSYFSNGTTGIHGKSSNVKEIGKTLRKAFSSTTMANASLSNSGAIKDAGLLTVSYNDFAKHFDDIVRAYDANEQSKFLAFETTLLVIRFFVHQRMRFEAFNFLTYTIYITNLQIKEEIRIRRYLEIGKLYDSLAMKRLATFYKWVSIVRIFRLIDKKQQQVRDVHLKCLIGRCCRQLTEMFDPMNIEAQRTPVDSRLNDSNGFPQAKLHVLAQLVQLSSYNAEFDECIRYCKYLLHEFGPHMDSDDFKYFIDFYYNLADKASHKDELIVENAFFKKFYKFPQLISFDVFTQALPLSTKTAKIKELDDSVYKYRYDPLQSRIKIQTYRLAVNEPNNICFSFFNPTQLDLEVETLRLVISSSSQSEQVCLDLNTFERFKIGSNAFHRSEFSFVCNRIGRFKIIGYEIEALKCLSRILFNELKSTNQRKQLIQPEYDVEMIPQIPVINDLRLLYLNNSTNYLSESKSLALTCRLGQCDIISLDYLATSSDLEVISFNFIILNEKLLDAANLNTKIEVIGESLKIKIDSTKFNMGSSLADDEHASLNCHLEIKYTNEAGRKENLCHVLKSQLTIKFLQPFLFKVIELNHIDERRFELAFSIENLLANETLHFTLNDDDESVRVDAKSEIELKSAVNRLDWGSKSNLDESFNLKYLNEPNTTFELFSDRQLFSDQHLSIIFKCPVKMDLSFGMLNKSTDGQYYSYLLMLKCELESRDWPAEESFEMLVRDELVRPRKFVVSSGEHVHRLNLIGKCELNGRDKEHILFEIIATAGQKKAKWKWLYSLESKQFISQQKK